jgi:3-methyladenine DNA glycosylase AlkD
MQFESILRDIRQELAKNSDPATTEGAQRFFREPIKQYGVRTPVVARIAKSCLKQLKGLRKPEMFALCQELFRSDYNEEAWIACEMAYSLRKLYEPQDFEVFEAWVANFVNNWAKCDTLCNHTIGEFVEQYPQYLERLKQWAKSDNRWLRRGAAVALIIPARRGKFLTHIFQIADILLTDKDDLVRKGYGWMLKAASESHQTEVFDYIVRNKKQMPRTALRYAIEKMPGEMRTEAMRP